MGAADNLRSGDLMRIERAKQLRELVDSVKLLTDRVRTLEACVAQLAQRDTKPATLEQLEQKLTDDATRTKFPIGSFVAVKLSVGGVWTGRVVAIDGDEVTVDLGKAGHHRGPASSLMPVPEGWT